jgi:hypothetical protein
MDAALTGWIFGAWLGARHAFEADHLAALATLLHDGKRPRNAALLGAAWGLGHTAALVGVGVVLVALRTELPARAVAGAELAVAAMLVVLGIRNIAIAMAHGRHGATHPHRHGEHEHVHAGPADHVHVAGWTLARRPLMIGLVHGLAGSGGLTALAVAGMPTPASALLYLVVFGVGSIAAMAILSLLAGTTLVRLAASERARGWLIASTGALSVAVGLAWGVPALQGLA